MKKILDKFERLEAALITLESIYSKKYDPHLIFDERVIIDATIQRFAFTFELFWKFLQTYFQSKGINLTFPRDILEQAYQANLISHEEYWINMLKDRNLTSHTYDLAAANTIFKNIQNYVPLLRTTIDQIHNTIIEPLKKNSV